MKKYIVLLFAFISFSGFAQYAEYEWEERDTWMNVDFIFNQAEIKKGSKVADIGCHEGYLTVHLANKVGEFGRVYAVDVREDRLDTLKGNLEDRELTNVEVILGDYDNPKLPLNTLDVVIIMDTYHEIEDYMEVLGHVKASLKANGKLVIIEKVRPGIKDKSRSGQTASHSMTTKYVKRELKKAGFKLQFEKNNLGYWEKDTDKPYWILVASKG